MLDPQSTKNPQRIHTVGRRWRLISSVDACAIALEIEMPDEPRHPSFEEVYPKFEFAPLVSAALYAAEWINRRFALTRASLKEAPKGSTPAAEV
jgi:hypothetical protein